MKVLGPSVLVFEAIVMGLFIPVAYFNGFVAEGATAVWVGGILIVLCLVASAVIRRPWGVGFGWVVQGLILATGLVVPMMFVVGGIFVLLWWMAIHFGRRADAFREGLTTTETRTTPSPPGERSTSGLDVS